MIMKVSILLIIIIAGAFGISDIFADQYEEGARAGYEKGLADGIRLTNEVLSEEVE